MTAVTRPCNQPLQYCIKIRFFFGTDAVTADLTMDNGFKVQLFNKLVDRQLAGKVRLIPKDKQRNSSDCWFTEESVKLFCRNWYGVFVCSINNEAKSNQQLLWYILGG